jgi:transcription elongation factor Elf1
MVGANWNKQMKSSLRKYQDPTRKDWILGILSLVIFVVAITLGAFLLFTDYWYLWLILVLGGVAILVLRQTKNYACRCRECGYEFEITFIKNLLSPHGVDKEGSWQWLQCPSCEKRVKVTVIKILKE